MALSLGSTGSYVRAEEGNLNESNGVSDGRGEAEPSLLSQVRTMRIIDSSTEDDSGKYYDWVEEDQYSLGGDEALTPFLRSPAMFFKEKFSAGSIKGSTFTLVVAMVGAGTLSVPLVFQQTGLVIGVCLFLLGGALAFFSLKMLVFCSHVSGVKSYSGLANAFYGPWLDVVAQCFLILNLYGTSISYIVAAGSQLNPIVLLLVNRQGDEQVPYVFSRHFSMIVTTCGIVAPLSLFRTMGTLRYSSLIAVVGSLYLAVVVMLDYFSFCMAETSDVLCFWVKQPPGEPIKLADFGLLPMLSAIPVVVFSYTCHPNVLPIFMELQKPSQPRMDKVIRRAVAIGCGVYTTLGVFAYLTFKDQLSQTQGNFLRAYTHPDAFILVGSIGLAISVIFAVPLYVNAFRSNVYRLFVGKHAECNDMSTLAHTVLSLGFVFGALLPAILVNDISDVFKVLGSTTNPVLCFLLPTMFFVKASSSAEYKVHRILSITITTIICSISFASFVIGLL